MGAGQIPTAQEVKGIESERPHQEPGCAKSRSIYLQLEASGNLCIERLVESKGSEPGQGQGRALLSQTIDWDFWISHIPIIPFTRTWHRLVGCPPFPTFVAINKPLTYQPASF